MGWATQLGPRPTCTCIYVYTSHGLAASSIVVSEFRAALDLDQLAASSIVVSEFRAALDLDHTYCSLCAERAKPGRGKPVLIMRIVCIRLFSRHISRNAVVSAKLPRYFSCPCSTGLPRPRLARLPVCCPVHCGSQASVRRW